MFYDTIKFGTATGVTRNIEWRNSANTATLRWVPTAAHLLTLPPATGEVIYDGTDGVFPTVHSQRIENKLLEDATILFINDAGAKGMRFQVESLDTASPNVETDHAVINIPNAVAHNDDTPAQSDMVLADIAQTFTGANTFTSTILTVPAADTTAPVSINFADKTADPASPTVGDLWRNGTALKYQVASGVSADLVGSLTTPAGKTLSISDDGTNVILTTSSGYLKLDPSGTNGIWLQGRIGVGVAPNPNATVDTSETFEQTSGFANGLKFTATANDSGNSGTATIIGCAGTVQNVATRSKLTKMIGTDTTVKIKGTGYEPGTGTLGFRSILQYDSEDSTDVTTFHRHFSNKITEDNTGATIDVHTAFYAADLTLGTARWALFSEADPCHLTSFVEIVEAAAPSDPASSARRLYVDSTTKKLSVRRSSSVSADIEASLTSTANDFTLAFTDDGTDATLTLGGSGKLRIDTGGIGVHIKDNLGVIAEPVANYGVSVNTGVITDGTSINRASLNFATLTTVVSGSFNKDFEGVIGTVNFNGSVNFTGNSSGFKGGFSLQTNASIDNTSCFRSNVGFVETSTSATLVEHANFLSEAPIVVEIAAGTSTLTLGYGFRHTGWAATNLTVTTGWAFYADADDSAFIGQVAIGNTTLAAQCHVDQASSSAAIPVLALDQGDINDTFINFIGTSAADGSRSISSDITENSAKFGAVRVEINGVTKWVRIYDDES